MRKIALACVIVLVASSFTRVKTLKGTWEYKGGIYNGEKEGTPTDYTLQRKYSDNHFDSFLLEKNTKPEKYEAGNYALRNDTCIETQTFSTQPTKLINVRVHYRYQIRHDSLVFNGTLPSGMVVEEYWKRVK
ncbi:MAG: hypothetical protein ACHQHN_12615 [Sphingobacteriales bacterium]